MQSPFWSCSRPVPSESSAPITSACASACATRSNWRCDHAEAAPLTILGDLVHNAAVLASCGPGGLPSPTIPAHVTTHRVMVTAHGASERMLASTRALGLEVVEATCPLVHGGASGHQGPRARRLSPGHHRPAHPCRGAGTDGRPRRVRRRARRERRAGARGTSADWALPPRPRNRSTGCDTWSR